MRRRELRSRSASTEREPGSAPVVVPVELRGRRVMTRLFSMTAELRTTRVEPKSVHLSLDDERRLFESASATFGSAGAEAARGGHESWRTFLRTWFWSTLKLELVLDAPTTHVA